MKQYKLPSTPNQTFEVSTGGHLISFKLCTYRGRMYIDAYFDNESVTSGLCVVSGHYILPRRYADMIRGNFRFDISKNAYPDYTMLGDGRAVFTFCEYGEM